ncbi:MAG: hypothetical protein RL748_876 [Pseudomonadota bacterium]|jgi:4-hydroxybenzoyl-CoA thioesterase
MIFRAPLLIRFAHCDPAGIVFYPRYFEMLNGVVEDWCAQGLGMDFHQMHVVQQFGLPTVRLETDFVQPSMLGETLEAQLRVVRIGSSSVELAVQFVGPNNSVRMKIRQVLVWMDLQQHKAVPLPATLRARIEPFIE